VVLSWRSAILSFRGFLSIQNVAILYGIKNVVGIVDLQIDIGALS
jgi:hypothetical protein